MKDLSSSDHDFIYRMIVNKNLEVYRQKMNLLVNLTQKVSVGG